MSIPRRLRHRLPTLASGGLLLLLVLMAVFRAGLLDFRMRPLAACPGCLALLTLRHDAAVVGVVLITFALATWAGSPRFRAGFRAFICLVTVLFGLDLLVIALYNMRLVVEDFIKYGKDIGGVFTITRQMLETMEGLAILLVMIVLAGLMAVFVRFQPQVGRTTTAWVFAAGVALLALGLVPQSKGSPNAWAYRNLFGINFDRAILSSYSTDFATALQSGHEDQRISEVCSLRPRARPDVVLVLLESFSMYQSRFFSGLDDFTPNMDRIAGNHTAFFRFWANGFTTENGLIALLGGQVPTPGPDQVVFGGGSAFDGFSDLPRSLPRLFEAHGYQTAFLSTGDLRFSGKGAWLDELGFQELIGHDDPFYDGWPRLHFSAAPDSALYLRALDWLDEGPRGQPFFLVIETVSSHHPFIEPRSRSPSEEAVFRYADAQLGRFYDALVSSGRLDSTLLVVASDHRTMTPVRPEELERFGEEARALVPFVIADPSHPGPRRIEGRYQQVDLASSIEAMLTGRSCPSPGRGDLLSDPPTPPRCVLHTRGDDRGRVDVVCGEEYAAVRLRGDHTRVENGSVPGEDLLVDQINFERLERRAIRGPKGR